MGTHFLVGLFVLNTIYNILEFQDLRCIAAVVSWSYLVRETVRERRDSRRGCVPALLPVVSCVLGSKSLIINTIHFSGLHAFAGGYSDCGRFSWASKDTIKGWGVLYLSAGVL